MASKESRYLAVAVMTVVGASSFSVPATADGEPDGGEPLMTSVVPTPPSIPTDTCPNALVVSEYRQKNEDLEKQKRTLEKENEDLKNSTTEKIIKIATILLGGGGLTGLLGFLTGLRKGVKKTIKKYQQGPHRVAPGTRQCCVLVVGLGRVGKTHLIKDLIQHSTKKPTLTLQFEIYHGASETHEDGKTERTEIVLADYRGQDLGQLVASFIKEQLKAETELRYGDIDAVIFVVDPFKFNGEYVLPEKSLGSVPLAGIATKIQKIGEKRGNTWVISPERAKDAHDNDELSDEQLREMSRFLVDKDKAGSKDNLHIDRIREHCEAWNDNAIDAVFGLLTDNLKYVCLWVNKIDLWKKHGDTNAIGALRAEFLPILKRLQDRCSITPEGEKVIVEMLLGSTTRRRGSRDEEPYNDDQQGINILPLKSRLTQFAKPATRSSIGDRDGRPSRPVSPKK